MWLSSDTSITCLQGAWVKAHLMGYRRNHDPLLFAHHRTICSKFNRRNFALTNVPLFLQHTKRVGLQLKLQEKRYIFICSHCVQYGAHSIKNANTCDRHNYVYWRMFVEKQSEAYCIYRFSHLIHRIIIIVYWKEMWYGEKKWLNHINEHSNTWYHNIWAIKFFFVGVILLKGISALIMSKFKM